MSVKVLVRAIPERILPEFHFGHDFREAIELSVHLLRPASMAAFLMATWRFLSDLSWTSAFPLSDGPFSHWQLWALLGAGMLALQGAIEKRMVKS